MIDAIDISGMSEVSGYLRCLRSLGFWRCMGRGEDGKICG